MDQERFDISQSKGRRRSRSAVSATVRASSPLVDAGRNDAPAIHEQKQLTAIENVRCGEGKNRPTNARLAPLPIPWWREPLTIHILKSNFVGPAWAVILTFALALLMAAPSLLAGGSWLARLLPRL